MLELSETHQMLRDTCRFADRELAPVAADLDRNHQYPQAQIKQLAELGLMSVAVDEQWGGSGLDNWPTPLPWKKSAAVVLPPAL